MRVRRVPGTSAGRRSSPRQRQRRRRPRGNPADTEVWEPVPKMVTPAATLGAPPADAVILFDGHNLDQWVSTKDKSPGQLEGCRRHPDG